MEKLEELENLLKEIDNKDITYLIKEGKFNLKKILKRINYKKELAQLQVELVKLQKHVQDKKLRIAILVEGRDAAGKGGAIRRFTHYLNPRNTRVVALPKPSKDEKSQWYFQRYIPHLPNAGEIVFFDRSWYNRAIVEPVNGFCTRKQYKTFMSQVQDFEHMLIEDGIILIKLWFSINKEEQEERFNERKMNPLKQWKLSPIDLKAQEKWDKYTEYKNLMFAQTHTVVSPWVIVKGDSKKKARLESIRYVLSKIDYQGKDSSLVNEKLNPNVIKKYLRPI